MCVCVCTLPWKCKIYCHTCKMWMNVQYLCIYSPTDEYYIHIHDNGKVLSVVNYMFNVYIIYIHFAYKRMWLFCAVSFLYVYVCMCLAWFTTKQLFCTVFIRKVWFCIDMLLLKFIPTYIVQYTKTWWNYI